MAATTYTESLSAGNTFLNPDGLLNFDAVQKLQSRLAAAQKAAEKKEGSKKPSGYYVISAKAKPIKYSIASQKKDDLKYQLRRATKVVERKTITQASMGKVKIILTLGVEGIPAALQTKVKQAEAAIRSHIKKVDKVKATVAKKKGKIRDAGAKEFEEALKHFAKILEDAGVKESNIVESIGMFGKTLLVKVSADKVITVGRSDIKRFNAAKRATKEK